MARRLADQAGLAQVLVARIVATWSPATLDERLALLVELLQLAGELDNRELTFRGRLFLAVCLFEAGDVARAQEELATATRLARELRQPFWNWLTKTVETMQLLLTGSTESEESIFAAFELGQRCRQPDAPLLMAVQLCIAWWTGAGCGTPSTDEGREHFELLASGGFDLPLDWTWLTGMTLLADTCALLGPAAGGHALRPALALRTPARRGRNRPVLSGLGVAIARGAGRSDATVGRCRGPLRRSPRSQRAHRRPDFRGADTTGICGHAARPQPPGRRGTGPRAHTAGIEDHDGIGDGARVGASPPACRRRRLLELQPADAVRSRP